MTLSLTIPDEVAFDLGDSEPAIAARVQTDLAALYYDLGLVSIGRAAEMSGLSRGDFEGLLAERGSVKNYSITDWEDDLAWASDKRALPL